MTETAIATQNTTQPSPLAAADRAAFELAQRKAKAFSSSSLVPAEYRGNLPNVMIAMELADRIGCSVFAIMQNVDVIHGRPSMRAKFLIATVNACGRFTPVRFRWEGEPSRGCPGSGCRAVAKDRETGEECVGPAITWAMVEAEGWSHKKGSKWQTMPELMYMYRAAAFWQRLFAPELSVGMSTREEVEDTYAGFVAVDNSRGTSSLAARLTEPVEAAAIDVETAEPEDQPPPEREPTPEPDSIPIEPEHDPTTGEVYGDPGK